MSVKARHLTLSFVVALLLGACGSASTSDNSEDAAVAAPDAATDGAASATAGKFSDIYPLIFPTATAPRCNFCHAMMANNVSNGSLQTGDTIASAYAALLDHESVSTVCKGRKLIVPGDPDNSLFLQKLLPTPPCGSRMPLGGSALTDAQLEMVRSWIAAGAKND